MVVHPKQVISSRHYQEDTSTDDPNADAGSGEGNEDTQTGNPNTGGHDYEKRWKDLKKYHDEAIRAEREKNEALQRKLEEATTQRIAPPKTLEELELLRQNMPEFWDAVDSLIIHRQGAVDKTIADKLKKLEDERENHRKEKERDKLLAKHPDAAEILREDNDAFMAWVVTQSQGVQALFRSDYADDVIEGLDLYKLKTKKQTQKPDVDASKAIPSSSKNAIPSDNKRVFRESEIKKMTAREFNALEAEIDQAALEGRIIYDLSDKRR